MKQHQSAVMSSGTLAGMLGPRQFSGGSTTDSLAAAKALFLAGEQGYIYDPSVLTSMFQDTAGTVPAAADQPVGRRLDLSGRGNHWTARNGTTGRPTLRTSGVLWWLEWDGLNNGGSTDNTIDFSTLGEMTCICALRKESDNGVGTIAELTTDYSTFGGFKVAAPGYSGPTFGVAARGSTNAGSYANNAAYAQPYAATFTGLARAQATPLCRVRLNGTDIDTSVTDQGAVNYPTAKVYSGFSGTVTGFFQGRTYLEILRNKITSGTLLTDAEAVANARRGV